MSNFKWNLSIYHTGRISQKANMMLSLLDTELSTIATLLYSSASIMVPVTPQLDMTIRVPLSEDAALDAITNNNPNYATLAKVTGASVNYMYFFFITNVQRLANNVINVSLHMDVLNTYCNKIITPSSYSSKTMIMREHKNRFITDSAFSTSLKLYRKVDYIDEGLKPALFWNGEKRKPETGQSYYLIYRSKSDISAGTTQPIGCYLCADNAIHAYHGASNPSLLLNDTNNGCPLPWYYNWFFKQDNPSIEIYKSSTGSIVFNAWETNQIAVSIQNASGNLYLSKYYQDSAGNLTITSNFLVIGAYEANLYLRIASGYRNTISESSLTDGNTISQSEIEAVTLVALNIGVGTEQYSYRIGELDRSDSRLVKIIKLPYQPVNSTTDTNGVVSFTGFLYDNTLHLYNLVNLSTSFSHSLTSGIKIFDGLTYSFSVMPNDYDTRISNFDSKLYNSNFCVEKIIYDSFSYIFQAEKIGLEDAADDCTLTFIFKPTNTMNSRIAFRWSFTDSDTSYSYSGDYDRYLIANRNNEMLIYSSDYLNYLRTGYNYDVKNKSLSDIGRWVGFGLGTVGAGIQASKGGAYGVTTAVGSLSSGLTNAIIGQIQSDNKLEETLAKGQAQSASVSGADDVDLLSFYDGDELAVTKWECRPIIKSMLDDLFYYYGYNCGYYGVPDWSSRTHFNYVQCQPIWKNNGMPQWAKDEAAKLLNQGVTYFKLVNDAYDLDQVLENWETWVLA